VSVNYGRNGFIKSAPGLVDHGGRDRLHEAGGGVRERHQGLLQEADRAAQQPDHTPARIAHERPVFNSMSLPQGRNLAPGVNFIPRDEL
jgi:hypothetical protein